MSTVPEKETVKVHFDEIATDYDKWKRKNAFYYDSIKAFINKHVTPAAKVMEVGCGTGEILASTRPQSGVGIDISPEMIRIAAKKFPQYTFVDTPIEDYKSDEKFDFIIMVDVVDHVHDIMDVFTSIRRFCNPRTKVVLTIANPWWDPILTLAEKLGAKMPEGPHNFIEKNHISRVLELVDFKLISSGFLLLFPKYLPVISYLANNIGTRIWGLNHFSAIQFLMIQPGAENTTDLKLGCSVVIPCCNEEATIEDTLLRIPAMGRRTEIIVVNDASQDETGARVEKLKDKIPHLTLIENKRKLGKGACLHKGLKAAREDVLLTLDADHSVSPEELPRFFLPLNKGLCQFVNGTRMVYPVENQKLRTLHLFLNKISSLLLSWITRQNVTDALCGTKAFYRLDYQYFQKGKDRWGDFDLLYGAAKLGSRILEVPVHFNPRKGGEPGGRKYLHLVYLMSGLARGVKELILFDQPGSKGGSKE